MYCYSVPIKFNLEIDQCYNEIYNKIYMNDTKMVNLLSKHEPYYEIWHDNNCNYMYDGYVYIDKLNNEILEIYDSENNSEEETFYYDYDGIDDVTIVQINNSFYIAKVSHNVNTLQILDIYDKINICDKYQNDAFKYLLNDNCSSIDKFKQFKDYFKNKKFVDENLDLKKEIDNLQYIIKHKLYKPGNLGALDAKESYKNKIEQMINNLK